MDGQQRPDGVYITMVLGGKSRILTYAAVDQLVNATDSVMDGLSRTAQAAPARFLAALAANLMMQQQPPDAQPVPPAMTAERLKEQLQQATLPQGNQTPPEG